MTIKKKLIGYGYTDNNGVATLDYNENGTEISTLAPTGSSGYIGRGVGNVQLEAGLHNSGTVVSQPCNIFDCLVYDGDNTPTSISWSKTNNAVVTDEVVSLIASVKNTNNNPCINIPVVFKQGNTVLGTAYTDCNGDATITQVWEDSDIFDVTATVGENFSEDITMFVKDKNITYLLYDIGVSSNFNNIWALARGTLSRKPEGTTLIRESGQTNVMGYFYLTAIDNFVIELDAIFDCENVTTDELHFRSNNWNVQKGSINLSNYPKDTWTHFKFEKKNGILKSWINETEISTSSNPSTDMFVMQLGSEDNYFKYKNFIMYSISNE